LTHALFRNWGTIDFPALHALCDEAVKFSSLAPQDCVFTPGSRAIEAYLVARGRLRYTQEPETSMEESEIVKMVHEGTWVCEAALWSHWIHVGKLEAETGSQLMSISASDLLGVLPRHPLVGYMTKCYGQAFHIRIAGACPPHSCWPNDLHIPYTDASDMISKDVGMGLLLREQSKKRLNIAPEALGELQAELETEKCAILDDGSGKLERIVALVAVRLENPDDNTLLVEVGKVKPGCAAKPFGKLPGTKRSRGELPHQALERILEGVLQPYAGAICNLRSEVSAEVSDSPSFGMRTRYLKTTFVANLHEGFEAPHLQKVRCSRQKSRRTSLSSFTTERNVDFMPQMDIIMVPQADKISLLSWVTTSMFECMGTSAGQESLRKALSEQDFTRHSDVDVAVPEIVDADEIHADEDHADTDRVDEDDVNDSTEAPSEFQVLVRDTDGELSTKKIHSI